MSFVQRLRLRHPRHRRGATLIEVVVATSVGAILLAQMGFFLGAFLRLEALNHGQNQAARVGLVIQDQIVPAIASAPTTGVSINPQGAPTPNNMRTRWESYDATVRYEALFWQEGEFLYGRWQETTVATGATVRREKLITYHLVPAGGVRFEWGGEGLVMMTLTWRTPNLSEFKRGWTMRTRP